MKPHPLEALSEAYLAQKNVSTSTKQSYTFAFKHFITYLKDQNIECAKTSDVLKYREEKRMLGHSTYSVHVQISALKGLYRYLRLNQKRLNLPTTYAHDIMTSVKNERITPHIKKPILTIKQAKQLILHTKNTRNYIWHYRDHAIMYVMITSGLRPIEVIHAKLQDYQTVEGVRVLYIREKAGLTDEYVKLSRGASCALDAYLKKRSDDTPYLFIAHRHTSVKGHLSRTFFKDMFARVLKDCGLDGLNITPHCLRHTAAILNLLRGASLESTKVLMRHVKIQSTLVYQDYIERMRDDSAHQMEAFILKEEAARFYDYFLCK